MKVSIRIHGLGRKLGNSAARFADWVRLQATRRVIQAHVEDRNEGQNGFSQSGTSSSNPGGSQSR